MPFLSAPVREVRVRRTLTPFIAVVAALLPWTVGAEDRPAGVSAPVRSVPEALNFANALFRERRYELAADEYERFLKDATPGPDADEARFGLANARLFQGKYAESRRQFEEFLKAAPKHPKARTAEYRVGETAYMLGDLPAARRAFETFVSKAKGQTYLETAWPYLGDVCLKMNDLPRARQAYEQALASFPQGRLADRARFGLGRTLTLQGEVDMAVQVLAVLTNRRGDWVDRAWLQIGQAQAGGGRFAQAVDAYETLERVAPKSPLAVEARLYRAEALIRLDRRDEAEVLLRDLMSDAPQNLAARAAFTLGSSQLERGKPAEALETLDDAVVRFPKTPMTTALIFRSAEAALKQGDADNARRRFLKAADADPIDPLAGDALIRAARIALDSRDYAGARNLAGSFTSRFPKSPLRADARLIEARVAMVGGRPKEAIAILTDSLAEDRPAAETAEAERYYLGLAFRADGQTGEADKILDALAKTPSAAAAANAQYLVGQGHFEAKRFAEAIPALEKYLDTKPEGDVAANAMTYIIWSRLELGQVAEAAKAIDQLAARFPKSATLAPTRLRLAWALLDAEKPAQAATQFATLVDAASDEKLAAEASYGRGRALEAGKQTDEALNAYALTQDKYPGTEQAGLAMIARARLLVELKRPAEGAALYEQYLQGRPDAANTPKGAEPDTLLAEWGWALIDAGKVADSDRVFARLLNDFPESTRAADARVNLAQSAYQAKRYDEVIDRLSPLVAAGAKTPARLLPPALFLMGRAQDKKKDWAEAAKTIDRLIAEYPENRYRREARFLRADLALKDGNAEDAESRFAALAAEPPADTDPDRFAAAIRQGRIRSLVELKRWKDVVDAAEAFQKENPKDPLIAEVDYARGRALQNLAQFDDARAAYKAVINVRKGGDLAARAQLMIGETFFHQKVYREALREYFKVATLYDAPTWQAAALLEAGKVYERLDQWAVAAETYEELRSKFPKDPSALEAKSRLEEARKHAQAPSTTETR